MLTYVKKVWTENTGGGCMVDMIELEDGRVIGINDECLVVYPSYDAFYNGIDGVFDFPAISFGE